MCLHPKHRDDSFDLNQIHESSVIDPDCYDRCDYVHKHVMNPFDLSIVQLNV